MKISEELRKLLEKRDKMDKMLGFIEERGDDGCESGDFNSSFVDLGRNIEYSSEEFQKIFYKEAKRIYKHLKKTTRIVDGTVEHKGLDY